jgi:nitrogen fixation/metabolism regulation signal transduction histidine kinase
MWTEGITTELASVRLPFLELLTLLLVFAVGISVFIVRAMLAPLRTLTEVASETSAGDLTAPLENRVAR